MAITLPYEGVLTEDITIDITDAVRKTWTVTINQSDHQTIHVWTPNKTAADKVDHTETFTINDGETIEPEVIADEGYTAGTIAITPPQ